MRVWYFIQKGKSEGMVLYTEREGGGYGTLYRKERRVVWYFTQERKGEGMVGTLNLVYYTEKKGKSEGMVLYTEHLRVDVKTDEETKPDLVAVSGEDQCQLPPPPTGTGLSLCQISPFINRPVIYNPFLYIDG